jgi:transglutaminase-like putative cysteine protease
MNEDMSEFLSPGRCVDSDHPTIVALAEQLLNPADSQQEKAVQLYYWVRDNIRYNPYGLDLSPAGLRASTALAQGEGWCVTKAALLAALCRVAGIPSRLGFADVRNHLSTERMRQQMQTDMFYYHGYCSMYLNGQWVKSTPAFNIELCDKFGLLPLEFDGSSDSLYHEFDRAGNRHMEYLRDRGEQADIPIEDMLSCFAHFSPGMGVAGSDADNALNPDQWDEDVNREVG